MKFGSVENPGDIDFTLPEDHPGTKKTLSEKADQKELKVYVGCAKWNRQELKNLYPKGTKDELEYYSTQFNAIELNATFYRYNARQISGWYEKVPDNFRFFPKVHQEISHRKWLSNVEQQTQSFLQSVSNFMEKRGTIFLQLRDNFAPKYFDRVTEFVENWPKSMPLALEFRHTDWYNDESVANELYELLQENNVANVITDTAGRRDLLHMRLTNNEAFIRYVGANHPTDFTRLDEWIPRLKKWTEQGLSKIHFFVHQNEELASPELSAHFIKGINENLGTELHIPQIGDNAEQKKLF